MSGSAPLGVVLAALLALGGCAADAGGRSVVVTDAAPLPVGPYSQGVRFGDTLYLAGQVGLDPSTRRLAGGGAAGEVRQALLNLGAVLEAAGYEFADVVQAQVFLADLEDYAALNAVWSEFFPVDPPARAAVQVAALPLDARVEILLVARK